MPSDNDAIVMAKQKATFDQLCEHIVAIVFKYDSTGTQTDSYGCITACIGHIRSEWFIVTAGHCITDYRQESRDGRISRVSLADYFAPTAKRKFPLRFDLLAQKCVHDDHRARFIDYAFVRICPELRSELANNGIKPLSIRSDLDLADFDSFSLIGFPAEYCVPAGDDVSALIKPTLVPVRRDPMPTPRGQLPQFVGDVTDMGNQQSIFGMSGGPIVGWCKNESRYELVAVQSEWEQNNRRVCACLMSVAQSEAVNRLSSQNDLSDESE